MKTIPLSLVLMGICAPAIWAAEPQQPGPDSPPSPDGPDGQRHGRQRQALDGWKKADANGDEAISRAEFGAMPRLENLPAEKLDALFKRLDKDDNGSLSRDELDRLFKPQDARGPMIPRLAELDTDHSGGISLEEFKASEIFKKLPQERQEEIFKRLDADGDGSISPKDCPPDGPGGPGMPRDPRDPRQMYHNLDKDINGSLNFDEFKQAPWIRSLPAVEQQERFNKLDTNKDQKIDGGEFTRNESKGPGRGEGRPREPRRPAGPAEPK